MVDHSEYLSKIGEAGGKKSRRELSSQHASEMASRRWSLDRRAHIAVHKAIKEGALVKSDVCSECGSSDNIVGHHHNGYDKEHWLDVQWLCRKCHIAKHPHEIHTITDDERGHRKPLSTDEPTEQYSIKLRRSTRQKLLDAGTKRVRAFLDSWKSE